MTISVIIPTYRRPDSLHQCLQGLRKQVRRPDEILVVTQEGDRDTLPLAERWREWGVVKFLVHGGGGAVGQYNRGLTASCGEIIVFTDDDAIPRPDWIERIERWFAENSDLGGLGGRDIIHQNGRILTADASLVGIVQWFGRIVHNHNVGSRVRSNIDILKGVNMSFRATAIEGVLFDVGLRGRGAQVCLDMAFSFDVQRGGWRLAFDPDVVVDHYPAQRFDEDQRGVPSLDAIENSAYNFYLTLRRHMRHGLRHQAAVLWAFWIGTCHEPGIVRGFVSRLTGDRNGIAMRDASRKAWRDAKRDCA